MKKPKTPINPRNPANLSPLALSRRYYQEVRHQPTDPNRLFDANIRIKALYHLPQMIGEDPPEVLVELAEDGDLSQIMGRPITSVVNLVHTQGFIVQAETVIWDFSQATFDKRGCFEKGPINVPGSYYIVYGFGATLYAAYRKLVEEVVQRQTKQIKAGLEAPFSSESDHTMTTYTCAVHGCSFGAEAPSQATPKVQQACRNISCPVCVTEQLDWLTQARDKLQGQNEHLIKAIEIKWEHLRLAPEAFKNTLKPVEP